MRCLTCHYDLSHLTEHRCPECGRAFDSNDPSTYCVPVNWNLLRWRLIYVLLLVITSSPAAYFYWRSADWWAYVHEGGGLPDRPKFVMPWWFQFGESAFVGLVMTAGFVILVLATRRAYRYFMNRRESRH